MDLLEWAKLGGGALACCFIAYLVFLAFVIVRTGGTDGLPNVAEAIRAFLWPGGRR